MMEKEQLQKMGNVVGSVKKPFDIDALVEFIKKIIILEISLQQKNYRQTVFRFTQRLFFFFLAVS